MVGWVELGNSCLNEGAGVLAGVDQLTDVLDDVGLILWVGDAEP